MNTEPPVNDRVIVAYYSGNGEPVHYRFDFKRLPLGSPAREARVAEFDRHVEALKGQSLKVFVWDLENWARGYCDSFYSGPIRKQHS